VRLRARVPEPLTDAPTAATGGRGRSSGTVDADARVADVRRFVDAEVLPSLRGGDRDVPFPEPLVQRMRELGLFGTIVPEAYGGLGLDLGTHARLIEEVARGWVSLAGVLNPHVVCCDLLLRSGTEEQRRAFLPRLATGEIRGAFSITEEHAGSDAQALRASARRTADGAWTLHGRKLWITNGRGADLVFVLVKTDPDVRPAHRGITCFITEKEPWAAENTGDWAGLSVPTVIDKMGDLGVETTDLVLDGYRRSGDRILGGEEDGLGKGFVQLMRSLESGRISASSLAVGVAQRCLEVALDYARRRETFGRPIAEHQAVQFQLADMATRVRASRLLIRDAAARKDEGARADLEAGMAKLFATDTCTDVAAAAFRIHGANGYAKEFEIERLHRDALSLVSAEGPNEIQRMVIGKGLVARAEQDEATGERTT
jgi:alkylation response protein AidB-like acyl-CoA dehydrogenase